MKRMSRAGAAALAACALAAATAVAVVAQQPGPSPAQGAPAGPRRGGGPPGGGPENGMNIRPPNGAGQKPAFAGQTRAPEQKLDVAFDVVDGGRRAWPIPWGLAFLPDGKMLVTERPGRLRVVSADGKLSEPVAGLPAVDARGQGGLLDVALDPAFADEPADLLELRRAARRRREQHRGRARQVRRRRGAARRERAGDLPPGAVARLAAALRRPPGVRAATARCSSRWASARSPRAACRRSAWTACSARSSASTPTARSRRTTRSSARQGVRPEIWSFGHRNVQAAALHPATGELWEVEHGTRGGDEINIVAQGQGLRLADDRLRHRVPGRPDHRRHPAAGRAWSSRVYYWDPVIAPSGMVFYTGTLFPAWKNSLFIGGLGSTQPRAADARRASRSSAKSACCRICSRSASASATCGRAPTARSIC